MKEKILALLKALGVIKDEDLAKVTSELDKLEFDKSTNIDTSKIQNEDLKKLIEGFQTQINSVMAVNKNLADALAAEKKARDEAIAAQTATQKTEAEKKITDAVEAAIKEGKYPEAKRDWLKGRFEKDFEGMTEIVKEAQVDKHFKPADKTNTQDKSKQHDDTAPRNPFNTNQTVFDSVAKYANITEN